MNDLLLLATLLEGPAHGYALKKRVGQITGQSDMHNNLVYPLLRRSVASGWVSRKTTPGERGQTRERYTLTSKGKDELVRRLEEFTEKDAADGNAFLLRVGLFGVLRRASASWRFGRIGSPRAPKGCGSSLPRWILVTGARKWWHS